MVRRTRAETSEANRRAVLDAARRQFELFGYHGASLDAIAEAAEFSKGAVYSRFDSKDDLFLAVLEDHIERRAAATAARLDDIDDFPDMAALARASIKASVATVEWQAALLEFRAHAWRDPEVNARYAELHRRTIASLVGFMGELFERRGVTPPGPPELLAIVGLASGTGIVTEFMADPDLDLDAVIAASVAGLGLADVDLSAAV